MRVGFTTIPSANQTTICNRLHSEWFVDIGDEVTEKIRIAGLMISLILSLSLSDMAARLRSPAPENFLPVAATHET